MEEVTLENLRARLAAHSGAASGTDAAEVGSGNDAQAAAGDEAAANPPLPPKSDSGVVDGRGARGSSSTPCGAVNAGPADKPPKSPRRSSTNDDAIEEIRAELQRQLERVQERRLRRREEAEAVAEKRQREIDRLRLENQALLKALGSNNSSSSSVAVGGGGGSGPGGAAGNTVSSDSETSATSSAGGGCRLQ